MAFELLSEAEIASWLRPGEALELLPAEWDISLKRRLILRRLADGAIKAYAVTAKYWDGSHEKRERLARIEQHLFARPWNTYDHDFWTAGDISFDNEKPPKAIYVFPEDFDDDPGPTKGASFTGVRLDPASFQQAFDIPDAPVMPDQDGDEATSQDGEKPRLSEALLTQWRELFTKAYPGGSIELAWQSVKGMFPRHHIARDRVRELFPNRAPGRPRKNKDNQ